jgi:hypothetical protein
MVRRFLSHFIKLCYAYAYKSKKTVFFKRIFYKGLLISKMDIYKCPKTKKIMLLFFTKKIHFLTYKIYMTLMVRKGGIHQFFTFFKKLCKLKIQKFKKFKKSKIQKLQ